MTNANEDLSLEGWDVRHGADVEWAPWGVNRDARVKVLAEADGYTIALIQADKGYRTAPHEHAHAEFFYLLDGEIRNQGETLTTGNAYAAATGSVHTDFEVRSPSTYLSIFRLG
jgi:quercetin dioxygenase-like cupin family protein